MTNKITPEMISNIVMAQRTLLATYSWINVSDDDSKHLVKVGDKLGLLKNLKTYYYLILWCRKRFI